MISIDQGGQIGWFLLLIKQVGQIAEIFGAHDQGQAGCFAQRFQVSVAIARYHDASCPLRDFQAGGNPAGSHQRGNRNGKHLDVILKSRGTCQFRERHPQRMLRQAARYKQYLFGQRCQLSSRGLAVEDGV